MLYYKLLAIAAPLTVDALRMPPPKMSMTEAQAKAAWLAKADQGYAPTTAGGRIVSSAAAYGSPQQQSAQAYEDRIIGPHSGAHTAYEAEGWDANPHSNWAWAPYGIQGQSAAQPAKAAPTSPVANSASGAAAQAYEDRILGKHSGSTTAYELGMENPHSNWAWSAYGDVGRTQF